MRWCTKQTDAWAGVVTYLPDAQGQHRRQTLRKSGLAFSPAARCCTLPLIRHFCSGLISAALSSPEGLPWPLANKPAFLLLCIQVALARCLGDGECLENLACLNLCNNRKDETACQVGPSINNSQSKGLNSCRAADSDCRTCLSSYVQVYVLSSSMDACESAASAPICHACLLPLKPIMSSLAHSKLLLLARS